MFCPLCLTFNSLCVLEQFSNLVLFIQLAGTNRPVALAQANAVLSRINLLCEIVGAALFGILLAKYELVLCLKIAAGLMMGTLPIVVNLTSASISFCDLKFKALHSAQIWSRIY